MAVNKCLICDTDLESFQRREVDHSQSADSVLSKDLHVVFVLRTLFEIPREKIESYLGASYGSPSEWEFVRFCDHCGEAVENAKRIYQEMLDATKIFAAVKQEIVETVRRHWRRLKDNENPGFSCLKTASVGTSDNLATRIVDETREFIHYHDYGSLMNKDPFVEGDLQARKLCPSKLFPGSTCHGRAKMPKSGVKKTSNSELLARVKNEPSTSEDENDLSRLYMSPSDLEVDLELQPSNSPLALDSDDHAKPCNTSLRSPGSTKTKRVFFKVKDLKNQQKQTLKSGSGTQHFMPKTSESTPPKMIYKCEFESCGRIYESKGKLVLHAMKHHENKPFYSCDWPNCNSEFTTAANLRRHKLSHSNERFFFKCRFCIKKYTRKYSLRSHEKKIHGLA